MAFSQKATIPRCYGKQLSKTVLHHGCFCLSFGNHHMKYLELFCFSKSETVAQTCSEKKKATLKYFANFPGEYLYGILTFTKLASLLHRDFRT